MHHEPPTQLARNWQCLPGRNLFLALLAFVLAADPAPAAEPRTVKVAAVPCSSQLGEVAANTQKLTRLIREAAAHGAKIVVLPEAAITGYLSQDGTTNGHVSRSPQTEEVWAHGRTPDHLLFIADDRRRGGYFIPIGNDEIGRGLPPKFEPLAMRDLVGVRVVGWWEWVGSVPQN